MDAEATEIVAIDGPAGAGKSTVARRAAEQLGFAFLDTGAMYRAATWWAMRHEVDFDDAEALAECTRRMPLNVRDEGGRQWVYVDGHDVTEEIRFPEVTRRISKLDHHALVRAYLVELQRAIGSRRPTVAEGRDIGTVVFPKAKCKIYLDASLDERTRRRAAEYAQKGSHLALESLREEIRQRDERDMTRAVSPLRRADDATLLDTTGMGLDDVIAAIVRLAKAKLCR
jgi:cytidylate kinase